MKFFLTVAAIVGGLVFPASPGMAQDAPPDMLITGARIFDGVGPELIDGQDVMTQGGVIARVGANLVAPEASGSSMRRGG